MLQGEKVNDNLSKLEKQLMHILNDFKERIEKRKLLNVKLRLVTKIMRLEFLTLNEDRSEVREARRA